MAMLEVQQSLQRVLEPEPFLWQEILVQMLHSTSEQSGAIDAAVPADETPTISGVVPEVPPASSPSSQNRASETETKTAVLGLPALRDGDGVDANKAVFEAGYWARAQGNPYLESLLRHMVDNVISQCECRSWNCGIGLHIGPAQFSHDTWASARRAPDADPLDYWEAGWAAANWISKIKGNEGTTSGWPGCWWVEGGP